MIIRVSFNLVELLIVLAIFSILASLLQPSIVSIKDKSEVSICASRLKALYMVHMLYTDDHDDFLVRAGYESPFEDVQSWEKSFQVYMKTDIRREKNKYKPVNDVLRCPSANIFNLAAWPKMHYQLNGRKGPNSTTSFVEESKYQAWREYGLHGPFHGLHSRPLSQLESPYYTIMMTEAQNNLNIIDHKTGRHTVVNVKNQNEHGKENVHGLREFNYLMGDGVVKMLFSEETRARASVINDKIDYWDSLGVNALGLDFGMWSVNK